MKFCITTSFLFLIDILLFESLAGTTFLLYGWQVLPDDIMRSHILWLGSLGVVDSTSLTFYYNLSFTIFFGLLGTSIYLNFVKRKILGVFLIILSFSMGFIWILYPLSYSDSDRYYFAFIGLALYLIIGGLYYISLVYCPKCDKVITDKKVVNSVTTDVTTKKKDGTNDLRYTRKRIMNDTWKYTCSSCKHSYKFDISSLIKG